MFLNKKHNVLILFQASFPIKELRFLKNKFGGLSDEYPNAHAQYYRLPTCASHQQKASSWFFVMGEKKVAKNSFKETQEN